MSADRLFVVKAEPCQQPRLGCPTSQGAWLVNGCCTHCLGNGERLDVSSAIPVEPQRIHHALDAENVDLLSTVFVPVSSTEAET